MFSISIAVGLTRPATAYRSDLKSTPEAARWRSISLFARLPGLSFQHRDQRSQRVFVQLLDTDILVSPWRSECS